MIDNSMITIIISAVNAAYEISDEISENIRYYELCLYIFSCWRCQGSPHQHDGGEDKELHTGSAIDFEDYSTETMCLLMCNTPKQMV